MLKKVVLPAPFGPIRLTMLPRGTVKSTSLHATKPPNSLRTFRASSRLSLMLGHGLPHVDALGRRPELDSASAARNQPLRSQKHHDHDHQPEDSVRVGRDVDAELL